ncbi:hypothetical protein SVA_2401 [Sulfurifustis variabilis]|uniref:Uncharacterized protein n=1 Tax=Sulfurifustis variabilis TaxID=1675686 RepID=A0A1B4V5Y3_9GAMM|nr:hypothetical protein [Sulfurifustis variabilis]BAU48950.1 hypothetical protein SVA_2401 [Sulfurifustis variabilis]
MNSNPAGAPRLRAFVRVLLSGGVWSVIAVQIAMLFLLRAHPEEAAPSSAQLRVGALAALFFALLYVIAGASHALARGRDTVSLPEVLIAGRAVYGRFLWLGFKAMLVFLVLFNLLLSVVLAASGVEMQTLVEASVGLYPWLGALIAFVFVYWMPVIFVHGNFALADTVRTALLALWHDRRQAAYLAFLTLTPTVLAALLRDPPPLPAVVALNVAGGVLGWTAYAFCVSRLQRAGATQPLAAVS